ncbi:hypothetical protein BJ912DRAFT_972671, partial [Pholiota molesta]
KIQPNRRHTKKRGQGKKSGRTPHTPPMHPEKRKRPRSPADASRSPRRRSTEPHQSAEDDARYGDAQPRPSGSAPPERPAEWPAHGGPSTSRQHDHPLATEDFAEEAWPMGSLRTDHLRAALLRDRAMAYRSTSRREHQRNHPPATEDEVGPMTSLQGDNFRAAMQEIQDHDHAIAGHSTSHRDHHPHPPATDGEVGPMAPPQWHLPRTEHYPGRSAEGPAQATGGPSTSCQRDHPLATEESEEERWAISSLESPNLRAVVRQIQAHTTAGRSTPHRDRLRAALRGVRERSATGSSKSIRDLRRHHPATEEEAGPMAPRAPQRHLPRAAHYSDGESITRFTRHP